MGNFLKSALKSAGQSVVTVVFSVITLLFLLAANIIAAVVYPFWGCRRPFDAANTNSLACLLGWDWLERAIDPTESRTSPSFTKELCRKILRPVDRSVIVMWNHILTNCAPMSMRQHFISAMGNMISENCSIETQRKYFNVVDKDRKVYLVQRNMLTPELLDELFKENNDNKSIFVEAGKISDEQMRYLYDSQIAKLAKDSVLSTAKQYTLIDRVFACPTDMAQILNDYIMKNGLHPGVIRHFYEKFKNISSPRSELVAVTAYLQFRQDLVMVQKTAGCTSYSAEAVGLKKYFMERQDLGYDAAVELNCWQYELLHSLGMTLHPQVIYAKLARVNKNDDCFNCTALVMAYEKLDDVAMGMIAGDEKLTAQWLKHLAKGAKLNEKTA
jgi:Ca2+-binding EF-hand superfamily protein